MPTVYSPPVPTYKPLASFTTGSAVSEITLNNFEGYKDLILVADFQASTGGLFGMRFNQDNAINYQRLYLIGSGTSVTGGQDTNYNYFRLKATGLFRTTIRAQIFDYDDPLKHKMVLFRSDAGTGAGGGEVILTGGRWPRTDSVTSIQCFVTAGTFDVGAKFEIFGVDA